MSIKTVETKKDLMEFIKFPWKIYKEDKNWVPQLISDMQALLDPDKNPFWKHATGKYFLALNDKGETVGRIAAIIDRNFVEFQEEQTGFFAFYESINDVSVAKEMIATTATWLKENGMTKMIGPTAPSTNDEMGFLYSGFDSPPFLMMPYNPQYYIELMEKCGLTKAKDLYAYLMEEKDAPKKRLERIAQSVKKAIPELTVRNLNMKDYANEVKRLREIYNHAWEKNWGFVPWTEEEFYGQCEKLKPLVEPGLLYLALMGDKPVGMLVGVPNYNFVLQKLNGKLGPIEILKFLYYKSKIKNIRVMIMGVIKEYRNKGIEGVMYNEIVVNGVKLGYPQGEFSWILEDNTMMCRAAEMLGGKVYKVYRVYENNLN
ncbi:MAG: hypothetical protein A2252_07125 [Elusimicrobia bacterium RIFOXYA2_FULL_39_19]|nr:MAG: hypothetical protein A2252_07125 [Elusimicrobia bacterium RIFOXYA2_FULL_39_19]